MQSKALIFVVALAFLISALGLVFLVSEGGFRVRSPHMDGQFSTRPLWLVLFIVPLFFAFSVLGYSIIFPDLNVEKPKEDSLPTVQNGKSTLDAVLRILNDDERKVVNTLIAEGATMLQKDIRWKTDFSRVKTHRVLFRLAKRGIVSVEKYYNTNKITLANWLIRQKKQA